MVTSGALGNSNIAGEYTVIIGFFITINYIYLIIIVEDGNTFLRSKPGTANFNLVIDITFFRDYLNGDYGKIIFGYYPTVSGIGSIDIVITAVDSLFLFAISEFIGYVESVVELAIGIGIFIGYFFIGIKVVNVIIDIGVLTGKVDIYPCTDVKVITVNINVIANCTPIGGR